ncbi:MAG TPA: hypothetical protein VH478_08580 [Trebonia sp.]|jgi:hypothetical protein|nr:hypothetical protein [Trebonia sp.]
MRRRVLAIAGARLGAILLGVAALVWAAVPVPGGGWASIALGIGSLSVLASAGRLAVLEVPEEEDAYFLSLADRLLQRAVGLVRWAAWEEAACVVVLWLEVLHPARAWHTAVLGVLLIAYLLAVHVAESGTPARDLLRGHARVLGAGLVLLALAAAATALPAASAGEGAVLLVVAAVAVIAAATLVLPG